MSASDTPRFVVPDQNLVPVSDYPGTLAGIPSSRMFLIKRSLDRYRARMGWR